MMSSPRKSSPQKTPRNPDDRDRGDKPSRRVKPLAPPFFAQKNAQPSNAIPSSSPAFATPAHPLKPFSAPVPSKSVVLPIILPPPTLRPLAFRTFTKKHGLTLASSALQELATFIGRHCGAEWREAGLAEKVLEEVARSWKNRNGGVIVDGSSPELKDILKTLEGNMSGGRIVTGPNGISRQNSLLLDSNQESGNLSIQLGLRPTPSLSREDSQASFGMSALSTADDLPEDESLSDARKWLKVINAFDQPRLVYNVDKKHFERDPSKPSLLPPASHKTGVFRSRFDIIHQRLLRNESFQTSAVTVARGTRSKGPGGMPSHKITPIANLLGRHGSNHLLLGMLVVLPTGSLAISDLTGTIALDLAQAVSIPHDSAWFTPGMIVLVDGIYEEEEEHTGRGLAGSSGVGGTIGGRFQGFFIGQPPCEKRKVTLGVTGLDGDSANHTIGGGFGWIDFIGVGSERAVGSRMRKLEHRILRQPLLNDAASTPSTLGGGRSRVIIIGELNLDKPRAIQALKKILALYAADPEGTTPMTFMLVGNFTTHAIMARGVTGGSIEYKEYFDSLAAALSDYPTLLASSTFVFVPGDNDGWISSFTAGAAVPLPRKPVPDLFTSRIRRAFAAANAENGLATATKEAQGPGGGENVVKGEAIWTTNPSRISVFGPVNEIVVFRDDATARLRRSSVRLKGMGDENNGGDGPADVEMSGAIDLTSDQQDDEMQVDVDDAGNDTNQAPAAAAAAPQKEALPYDTMIARKLVKTLLDQGHLAPFKQTTRPVHWDYASSLYLYPLPTAMVLVDTTAPPFCITYEGCHVMNPSSILVPGRKGIARWVEYDIVGLERGSGFGKVRECMF
ncbi:DNA polymerase [Rhypophila decipiens]